MQSIKENLKISIFFFRLIRVFHVKFNRKVWSRDEREMSSSSFRFSFQCTFLFMKWWSVCWLSFFFRHSFFYIFLPVHKILVVKTWQSTRDSMWTGKRFMKSHTYTNEIKGKKMEWSEMKVFEQVFKSKWKLKNSLMQGNGITFYDWHTYSKCKMLKVSIKTNFTSDSVE